MKRILFISFLLSISLFTKAQDLNNTKAGLDNNQIIGLDHFGRTFNTITGYQPKKQIGLFYSPWIGQPYIKDIYDAAKITKLPDGLKLLYDFKHLNDSISPNGQFHFWGEPIWGYYNSDDEWVIRRHIKMLTMAGVDFIVFDVTNSLTYKNVYIKILNIINDYITQGWNPPKVAFYTHSYSFNTARNLYKDLYQPELYSKTWYRVGGKPMIIAYTNPADDIKEAKSRNDTTYNPVPYSNEIKNFFYFKKPQWPFDPVYPDGFPWIEWIYPQPLHGNTMSVTVASHPKVPMSRSITSGWENWGRGWDPIKKINDKEKIDIGGFFQWQWDNALKINPDTIFVGGWNEWIALKQPYGDEYMLCDAADKEFSRDIEPMKGGYEDAFYIQMIQNIRKYKGIKDPGRVFQSKMININKGNEQWGTVDAVYRNIDTNTYERNSYGAAKTVKYYQKKPLNNLQEIRVTHDADNFYFFIRCGENIVRKQGENNWMNLFLGIGDPTLKGWSGYDYVIGRNYQNDKVSIGKLNADYSDKKTGKAEFSLSGNVMQFKVPRKLIHAGNGCSQIYFKIADGVENSSDIMNYYKTGSVMPLGRLSYLYKLK